MLGCSGLHFSSPFLKGTLLLCCQGSVNVRMRILICEPHWDSGAVAADFTAAVAAGHSQFYQYKMEYVEI